MAFRAVIDYTAARIARPLVPNGRMIGMTPSPNDSRSAASHAFFAARDQLLELAGNPEAARADFRWPDVGDDFNWAHDVFDVLAEGNDTTALWIAEADGSEVKRSGPLALGSFREKRGDFLEAGRVDPQHICAVGRKELGAGRPREHPCQIQNP